MIMPAVSKKIGWSVKRATTEYPHAASDPTDMSVSIVASKARSLFSAIRWNWDPKANTTGVARATCQTLVASVSVTSIERAIRGAVNAAASSTLRR